MTPRSGIDVASHWVTASLRVLLVAAMAVVTASPARGEMTPPVDVSSVDDTRKFSLTGHLYRPNGSGPFPAVVMMHGCGGVRSNQHD
jgi:poly(3-hydroxybutyrate) depolymerase